MTIQIRPYRHDEVPLMLDLIKTAFSEQATDPPSSAERKTLAILEEELAVGGAFVAILDGELIGCVLYEPTSQGLYFHRLAVSSAHRGLGIARQLIAMVEHMAQTDGYECTMMSVRLALPKQRAMYESLGYQVYSYGTHAGFVEPTFVTMRKYLQ